MKQPFICMQKQLCVRICFMCVCGIIIPASGFLQLVGSPGNLHITWPKYRNFTISPSSEYSELISFRIGWLDLLALQGTLKSLLECHNSKASLVHHSAFFMVQFHTRKTKALTRWTFVGKPMPILFNALSLSLLFLQEAGVF